MNEFIIPYEQFAESKTARYITDDLLCDSVARNNESWEVYHDKVKMALVARCKNKPRGLLVYGLKWLIEATKQEGQ